jgi:hypothetical protein
MTQRPFTAADLEQMAAATAASDPIPEADRKAYAPAARPARRQIRTGDRRFGVTGCGCDIFFYAPLLRPSLQVEDTCSLTGTPIRLVFTPGGVERVWPRSWAGRRARSRSGRRDTARPQRRLQTGTGSPGSGTGLITFINPQRAQSAPPRQLQIGHRRFGMTGSAPDVFLYAPLLRPSLQVEETCTITGTPIRVVFSPGRVESVEPAGAVAPILPPQEFDRLEGMSPREADACMCAQCPFYSSAEAAQGWLAAHTSGRVFPVREAWDLSFHRAWRDRMSALLNLGN